MQFTVRRARVIGDFASAGGIASATIADAPQTTAFLARANAVSTLDATHTSAYRNLINGLVADGLWSSFDLLYIFATSVHGIADLNLISTSFTISEIGAPTFTTDRGFNGTDTDPATVNLDPLYNPLNNGVNITTTSAHMSTWCVTNIATTNGGALCGAFGGSDFEIFDTYIDGNVYGRVFDTGGSLGAPSSRIGHWIVTRTGASLTTVYQNASVFATPNTAGGGLTSSNLTALCYNNNGTASRGTPNQLAMWSVGAGFTGSQATAFYNRLRTYMTAVGVP